MSSNLISDTLNADNHLLIISIFLFMSAEMWAQWKSTGSSDKPGGIFFGSR